MKTWQRAALITLGIIGIMISVFAFALGVNYLGHTYSWFGPVFIVVGIIVVIFTFVYLIVDDWRDWN